MVVSTVYPHFPFPLSSNGFFWVSGVVVVVRGWVVCGVEVRGVGSSGHPSHSHVLATAFGSGAESRAKIYILSNSVYLPILSISSQPHRFISICVAWIILTLDGTLLMQPH